MRVFLTRYHRRTILVYRWIDDTQRIAVSCRSDRCISCFFVKDKEAGLQKRAKTHIHAEPGVYRQVAHDLQNFQPAAFFSSSLSLPLLPLFILLVRLYSRFSFSSLLSASAIWRRKDGFVHLTDTRVSRWSPLFILENLRTTLTQIMKMCFPNAGNH